MPWSTTLEFSSNYLVFNWCMIIALGSTGITEAVANAANTTNIAVLTVSVSQSFGVDVKSCLPRRNITSEIPCKSIHYAYRNLVDFVSSSNSTYSILIDITDVVYSLEKELVFDKDVNYLASLKLRSATCQKCDPAKIVSKHPLAKVVVGNLMADFAHGLRYNVVFEGLTWTNFSDQVPACLSLYNARNVIVLQNVFEYNNCSGINSFDSKLGIMDTNFSYNMAFNHYANHSLSFPSSNASSGGAVGIVFKNAKQIDLHISDCYFRYNGAVILGYHHDSRYIYHNATLDQFGRIGGGLAVIFANTSNFIFVFVSNCTFQSNIAFGGGGVTLLFQSKASLNQVFFNQCKFLHNLASEAAGGLLFATWDNACRNTMVVENSTFLHNTADYPRGASAGAVKIVLNSKALNGFVPHCSHDIHFKGVTFVGNCAKMGAAVHILGMVLSLKALSVVRFTDCEISDHHNCHLMKSDQVPVSGTFIVHGVDVMFSGVTSIHDNDVGSAVSLSNSVLYLSGTATFERNKGENDGGAMVLRDVSFLVLSPGTELFFVNNSARGQGGALHVHGLMSPYAIYPYNPLCFLQYTEAEVPPSDWKVKVVFRYNSAGFGGAAVFTNTLWGCSWGPQPPYVNISKALRWHPNFIYEHNYLIQDDVRTSSWRTDINTDNAEMVLNGQTELALAPGEVKEFNLTGFDELHNPVYVVPIAVTNGSFSPRVRPLTLNRKYYAISPQGASLPSISYKVDQTQYDHLPLAPSVKQKVYFEDVYSLFESKPALTIFPVKCRPGMTFDAKNGTCICNSTIPGILRCSENVIYLRSGYWANIFEDNQMHTYRCPDRYCSCTVQSHQFFGGCPFNYDDPDQQCVQGRQGTLCGKCKEGLGVSLKSHECLPCEQPGRAIGLFVFIVLVIGAIAVVILILNPGFSTFLRGPVFFCQTLPFLFQPNDKTGIMVNEISSYLDPGSPSGLPFSGCLFKGINSLEVIALEYTFPLVVFSVLVICYVLHKLHILNLRRGSPFQAFWLLLVMIYKLLVETSLLLMFCVPIAGNHVFFYDGSIKCFEGQHLLMLLVSSIVILTMVLPPPILVALICFGYVKVQPHVSDALAKGLRRPYRWWWSVDFFRRIVFISLYVFIPDWVAKQLAQTVASLVTFTLHTQCKPYESNKANLGETLLLFSMTLMSTIQLLKDYELRFVLSTSLLCFTHIYVILITVWCCWKFCKRKMLLRKYRNGDRDDDSDDGKYRSTGKVTSADFYHACTDGICDRHFNTDFD